MSNAWDHDLADRFIGGETIAEASKRTGVLPKYVEKALHERLRERASGDAQPSELFKCSCCRVVLAYGRKFCADCGTEIPSATRLKIIQAEPDELRSEAASPVRCGVWFYGGEPNASCELYAGHGGTHYERERLNPFVATRAAKAAVASDAPRSAEAIPCAHPGTKLQHFDHDEGDRIAAWCECCGAFRLAGYAQWHEPKSRRERDQSDDEGRAGSVSTIGRSDGAGATGDAGGGAQAGHPVREVRGSERAEALDHVSEAGRLVVAAGPNACVECQPWPIGTKNPKAERFVKWATQSFPIADTLRYACKKCNGTGIVTHEASPSSSVALIGAEAEIRTLRSDCVDYRAALHAIAYAEHNSEASDWQEYAEEMQVKARIALGHEDAEGRVFSDGDRARGRAFIGEPGPRQATPFTRKAGGDAP